MLNIILKIRPLWIYSLILLAWAALTLVSSGLVYRLVLHEAEAAFNQRTEQIYENIERIARDNEAILEGFSAFLSAIEYADRESASRYAKQILAHYPYVYRLEVILIVKRNDLSKFIARQKNTWFPKFKVKQFSDKNGHTWKKSLTKKPQYYPIIFIEPMLPSNKQLIGADLNSLSILSDAINQSTQIKSSAATVPFDLVSGPRGYALFHPVPNSPKESISKRKQALVLLEIDAEAIRRQIVYLAENLELRLYHADYPSDNQDGLLFQIDAPPPDNLEARFLPKLTAERMLNRRGQPFAFKVHKQLGWIDINMPLIVATSCVSLMSLAFLIVFMTSHYRREKQRKSAADRLLHLATHDALTGLPNRTLLTDRFSQACTRTQRRDTPFSTMFIDLNNFKLVNDTYGHEVGDQLLKTLGGLLKECVREEDTLSRISGDEFVILLEDASYANAERVAQKIRTKLTPPVPVQGIELAVSLSIGIAVYPEDGTTMSDLLRTADQRMYAAKEQNKIAMAEHP